MSERNQCIEILKTILEQNVFYNNLKPQISENNIAFCNMLILNVLRHLNGLENIIKQFVSKKIPQKNIILKYILLTAITELLLLKTPDYAVINEYVNIAKQKTNKYAANMINAVLRKIAAQKQTLKIDNTFSKDFLNILQKDYSKEQIELIAKSISSEAPLDLTIKTNHEFWTKELNGTLFSNGTIRLYNSKTKISELKGYEEGAWWVQDIAASLPIILLGDIKDKKILDLCAAPGGKTAQLLAKGAKVTAVDVDSLRMEKLKQNINRLKLSENLETYVDDGLQFLQNNQDVFDIIVLDAPCSATGTFRKHPEILHLKTIKDIGKQVSIQYKMLQVAISAIKKDGIILYCTCSISKEEGEKVINTILKENKNIVLLKPDINKINYLNGKKLPEQILDNGVLRTLPYYIEDAGGMDSFFAACLRKLN